MAVEKFTSWYLQNYKIEPWAFIDNLFTAEECEKIKVLGNKLQIKAAGIGSFEEKNIVVNTMIRKNRIGFFNTLDEESSWIYRRLTDAVNTINAQFYNFNLDYIECLQYTIYEEQNDHYEKHIDLMFHGPHTRKLSFSLQLDDADTYKGCDLELFTSNDGITTKRNQGSMIVFPSWIMHRVTNLEVGTRHSLVGWVCGPAWK